MKATRRFVRQLVVAVAFTLFAPQVAAHGEEDPPGSSCHKNPPPMPSGWHCGEHPEERRARVAKARCKDFLKHAKRYERSPQPTDYGRRQAEKRCTDTSTAARKSICDQAREKLRIQREGYLRNVAYFRQKSCKGVRCGRVNSALGLVSHYIGSLPRVHWFGSDGSGSV